VRGDPVLLANLTSVPRGSSPFAAPLSPISSGLGAPTFNRGRGGRAAETFNREFGPQLHESKSPGSVRASREALGLREGDLVMIDIGGKGQKTDVDGLVSGNLNAININAQPNISLGRVRLQTEADEPARCPAGKGIPNLVNIDRWPPPEAASAEGFVPLAKGFSDLTTMEGTPVFSYHVAELDRVTSEKG